VPRTLGITRYTGFLHSDCTAALVERQGGFARRTPHILPGEGGVARRGTQMSPPRRTPPLANAAAGALVLAAAQGMGGDEVLAANLRDTPRARILDECEFELLRRGE